MKNLIRNLLGVFGFILMKKDNLKLMRKSIRDETMLRPWLSLQDSNITNILDVGSNEGQFASFIHTVIPNAEIIMFEPLLSCRKSLENLCKKNDLMSFYQVAIGDTDGEVVMNECDFTPSSSLLEMRDEHKQIWKQSAGHRQVTVPIHPLDHYLYHLENAKGKCLLKIDVQGYERSVLAGAKEVLKFVDYVVMEVSFRPFYEGQASFRELNDVMYNCDFEFKGCLESFYHDDDKQLLYSDVLYQKKRG